MLLCNNVPIDRSLRATATANLHSPIRVDVTSLYSGALYKGIQCSNVYRSIVVIDT